MPFFSLEDLNQANTVSENFGINLAKGARGFACNLYKNYSTWAKTLNLPIVPPASLIKGVWDTVCAESPGGLPPAPASPFNGGQCPACYIGEISWEGVTPATPPGVAGIRAIGPITATQIINLPGGGYRIQLFCRGACYNSFEPTSPQWHTFVSGSPPNAVKNEELTLSGIVGGAPDNCGNPPPVDPPYVAPPPADLTTNINIEYNDGSNTTVPLTWIDVSPNLDLNVDVGGVAFNFNVDGVRFNFNLDKNGDNINPPGGPAGGGGSPGSDNNSQFTLQFDNITNKVENLTEITEECCPKVEPPDSPALISISYPTNQSLVLDNLVDLVYVRINLSAIGDIRIQYGDNAPNIYFAGWMEFRIDQSNVTRIPIHFEESIFLAPDNANGFAYTIVHGGTAQATGYFKASV